MCFKHKTFQNPRIHSFNQECSAQCFRIFRCWTFEEHFQKTCCSSALVGQNMISSAFSNSKICLGVEGNAGSCRARVPSVFFSSMPDLPSKTSFSVSWFWLSKTDIKRTKHVDHPVLEVPPLYCFIMFHHLDSLHVVFGDNKSFRHQSEQLLASQLETSQTLQLALHSASFPPVSLG